MLKKFNLLLILLIGLVLFSGFQRPKEELKLVFCNVGQGDATLMIWKDQEILVDGGPDNRVLDCLGRYLPFWDRKIEVVIVSHAEADHITGLVEVVERFEIGRFLIGNEGKDTAEYRALKGELERRKISTQELLAGNQLSLGPISLRWLWPTQPGTGQVLGASTSLNPFTQVIEASFGTFDWLLTGDIDTAIERQLVTSGTLPEVEVLKVAHHGSKYSSSQSFLQSVSPELAVIEVGKNSFGHPTDEVLGRLNQVGAQIKRTDQGGDVVVVSDGQHWQVK